MTAQRYSITFPIKPGSEEPVASLLASYGRPVARVDDSTRLLATAIFLKDQRVVRIFDIEGSLPAVMQHLGRQPVVQTVEDAINPHLMEERDMSTADGARAFFMRSFMTVVTAPPPPAGTREDLHPHAALFAFRPGCGPDAERCFTDLGGTSVFRKEDLVVRFVEIAGGPEEAVEQLAAIGVSEGFGDRLQELLATPADLATKAGWMRYLEDRMMRPVTYRIGD